MGHPALSVVVAAEEGESNLVHCLESLEQQRGQATEVLVASNAAAPVELAHRFPWVRWLEVPGANLIPQLWGQAAREARAEVIAFTTAQFTPAADWLAVVRDGHARLASAAVGGPIDPPRGRGPVAWATYFLRYSAYLGYEREQEVEDLAADNASYTRRVITGHAHLLKDGFWEHELHRPLRQEGLTLTFLPGLRVAQRGSFGFVPFVRQRFVHGQRFGRKRLLGRSRLWRLAAVLGSPLIPVVFTAKIARRVLASRRDLLPFLGSLPVLFGFVLAWSAGEAWGYVRPGAEDP